MEIRFKYRGKVATDDDIEFIKKLISDNSDLSRRALSQKLCIAWNWVQPNGTLRDMVCRGYMLGLHRGGFIELPKKRQNSINPFLNRKKPEIITVDESPIISTVKNMKPLKFEIVRQSSNEKLCNSLIEQFHYLGYCQPVGEQLKYLISANDRPIACMTWSSAPRHIGPRDKFIGWNKKTREQNLSLMAYNSRFLILPWVRVPYLASHILGRMARELSKDWEQVYNHPVYYLETFVDTERFKGTCYKAANWLCLGTTTGRGKNDQTGKANRSLKAIYGYPLTKDFQNKMTKVAK